MAFTFLIKKLAIIVRILVLLTFYPFLSPHYMFSLILSMSLNHPDQNLGTSLFLFSSFFIYNCKVSSFFRLFYYLLFSTSDPYYLISEPLLQPLKESPWILPFLKALLSLLLLPMKQAWCFKKRCFRNWCFGNSLVTQWLRICLPMQGTRVWALVQEDPTCRGATKPMRHNYWACALEPTSHNYWAREPQLLSPWAATTEACTPRAHAPQQEKPPQWEACAPQRRVAPAHHN